MVIHHLKKLGWGQATSDDGGNAGNNLGDFPDDSVEVTDHSKRNKDGASCEKVSDVDENKVNELLDVGKKLGRWWPTNQCQSFVKDVLDRSRIDAYTH